MARVEGGAVTIITDWPSLKDLIDTRNLNFRFEENSIAYEVFSIDGQYFYTTLIYKAGQAPENQSTYDTYRTEFEASYKYKITDFNATDPFFLTSQDGYSVVLKDGNAPTSNDGYGIAVIGIDGSNYRMLKMDTSGRPVMVGAGTAGSPVGGLITIQGDPSGTPLPISGSVTASGTITANQGTANTAANGWPVKITDGTNILGTSGNPIRIDPTGTTTQPISGTVTANAGTGNFAVVQATAALLNATVTANGNFNNASVSATAAAIPSFATFIGGSVTTGSPTYTNGNMNALSLTTAGALRIDGSAVTQPISGTVTANAGTGTFSISGTVTSNQGTSPWVNNITQFGGNNVVTGTGTSGIGIPRVTVSNDSNILATQSGTWTVAQGTAAALSGAWPVKVTDGTNTMPTGDAIGRAIFQKITDGTNTAGVDSTNHLFVAGKSAVGVAPTANPVAVSGVDGGGLKRAFLTDTTGKLSIVGAAADGTAVTGNPVLIGGQDGTNVQSIATDGYGRIQVTITGSSSSTQVEGRAADGNTPVGNPVLIGGYDGANTQTVLTDTSGRIVIAPSGASTTSGFSFGDVALSSITTSVVRRTTYNEQTTNAQRSIASSNANDTSAGTGARQVKITYYDSTGAGPYTETVTLNGTTAVATSNTNICFIEEMSVVSVGSGGVNAGIITLYVNNSGGGGTIGTIATGDNATYWSHHYVPTGKTNFITSLSVVVNGGGALFFIRAQTIGVSTAPNVQVSDYVRSATQSGTSTRIYGTPIQTVGPARLLMYVTTEANTSLTYRGAFDYYDE